MAGDALPQVRAPTLLIVGGRDEGVLFSLSTDAHQLDHLHFMELAVGTAQRAWLGPTQILNTRPLAALLDWLREVRG